MDIHSVGRWFARRDWQAGSTRAGGIIQEFKIPLATVLGLGQTITSGILDGLILSSASLLMLWSFASVAGYIDIHYLGWSKYRAYYGSVSAPNHVIVIKDEDRNKRP